MLPPNPPPEFVAAEPNELPPPKLLFCVGVLKPPLLCAPKPPDVFLLFPPPKPPDVFRLPPPNEDPPLRLPPNPNPDMGAQRYPAGLFLQVSSRSLENAKSSKIGS